MIASWSYDALVAVAYGGCAAAALWCSVRICRTIVPFDDGPVPGSPPSVALIAGSAGIGFLLAHRAFDPGALTLCALLVMSLCACWYTDVRCGVVPDVFTLLPLGAVLAVGLARADPWPLLSALILCVPFAAAALASRGLGMGWGDVKLVALAAAALGMQTSLVCTTAACVLASAVGIARKRRSVPIAFAPYLAGSIAVALAVPGAL